MEEWQRCEPILLNIRWVRLIHCVDHLPVFNDKQINVLDVHEESALSKFTDRVYILVSNKHGIGLEILAHKHFILVECALH